MAGDDAVAGDELLVHAEIAAAVGDQLVELLERAGIEQQLDPLAGGQLAGFVLAREALGAAAQLGAPLEVGEDVFGFHRGSSIRADRLTTACAFSQSFRNFSRPMLVSGWLKS